MSREEIRQARDHVQRRLHEFRAANPTTSLDEEPKHAERFLDEWLQQEAHRRLAPGQQGLGRAEEQEIRRAVFNQVFGLGELQPLLRIGPNAPAPRCDGSCRRARHRRWAAPPMRTETPPPGPRW